MTSKVAARPERKSFSRLDHVLDVPNLIDIQKASFAWFMEEGLRETIEDISPIEDYTGTLAVEFGSYAFKQPQFSIKECREKDLTYEVPLEMVVRFVNKDTGEIREQTVFMGNFPRMTDQGTFIINGTERVIVTQLVRSPGAYLMEPKDATKQVFTANLMPSRGSWLELEIDKKGAVYARIDRKRKLPITTLLRALPTDDRFRETFKETLKGVADDRMLHYQVDASTNEKILELFDNSHLPRQHPREGSLHPRGGGGHRGLQEAAAGRAADARERAEPPARPLLRREALRPDQGRPLQAQPAPRGRRARGRPRAHAARHPRADAPTRGHAREARRPRGLEGFRGGRHRAAAGADREGARRVRALRQSPASHRRRADPGGVPRRPLSHGARRARAHDHRGRRHDHAADDHQRAPGAGGAEGVLRLVAAVAVHGPDELARVAHAPTAALRPRRRRPHARARTDRGARRSPDALRPHVPDRDAGGPEHRPHRLARLVRDGLPVRVRPDALPGRQERQGDRRDHLPRRVRGGEVHRRPGERADRREDRQVRPRPRSLPGCRRRPRLRRAEGHPLHGRQPGADRVRRDRADPVPRAQRCKPCPHGLEHAAPGGAAPDRGAAARGHRARVPRRGRHR